MADLPNGGEVAPPLINLKGSDTFFFKGIFLINLFCLADTRPTDRRTSLVTTQPPPATAVRI
jgi:hypothetical protein